MDRFYQRLDFYHGFVGVDRSKGDFGGTGFNDVLALIIEGIALKSVTLVSHTPAHCSNNCFIYVNL